MHYFHIFVFAICTIFKSSLQHVFASRKEWVPGVLWQLHSALRRNAETEGLAGKGRLWPSVCNGRGKEPAGHREVCAWEEGHNGDSGLRHGTSTPWLPTSNACPGFAIHNLCRWGGSGFISLLHGNIYFWLPDIPRGTPEYRFCSLVLLCKQAWGPLITTDTLLQPEISFLKRGLCWPCFNWL